MDASSWVAIAGILGTLIASATSIVGTYIVQSKVSEREKKWAREDDEKKRRQELEDDQKRIKRELITRRLNVIEEAANTGMFLANLGYGKQTGDPIYIDETTLKQKRKQLEEISIQAWSYVEACGSHDLREKYQAIMTAYYEDEQYGEVNSKTWEKASESLVELLKIIDDMKAAT